MKTSQKKPFVFLVGGVSSEHDASTKSFEHMFTSYWQAKDACPLELVKIYYIGRDGQVFSFIPTENQDPRQYFRRQGPAIDLAEMLREIKQNGYFVFSTLHGQNGEDGAIQGAAKFIGTQGALGSTLSCSLAMSKYHMNNYIKGACPAIAIPATLAVRNLADVEQLFDFFPAGAKIVLKPNSMGSSVFADVFTCLPDQRPLISAHIAKVLQFDAIVLAQEFIEGQEYSCGCIEMDGKVEALPLVKIQT
jgi:D-alanine-D-alanine ligase